MVLVYADDCVGEWAGNVLDANDQDNTGLSERSFTFEALRKHV
jgi:hypothetical protein